MLGEEQRQAMQSQQAEVSQPHQSSDTQQSHTKTSAPPVVHTNEQQRKAAELAATKEAQARSARPKPKPQPKPIVTEIQLSDEVTIRQLAQQLDVPAAQVEQSLLELGERPSSHEDILSPENAELAAMSFGKTVVYSQAFLVRLVLETQHAYRIFLLVDGSDLRALPLRLLWPASCAQMEAGNHQSNTEGSMSCN